MSLPILIPTALRQFAAGNAEVIVEGKTVGEALENLTTLHASLKKHLYNDKNALRSFVNVYLNDEDIRHLKGADTLVPAGATLTIVPSIAGGLR